MLRVNKEIKLKQLWFNNGYINIIINIKQIKIYYNIYNINGKYNK